MVLELYIFFVKPTNNKNHRCNFPVWWAKKKVKQQKKLCIYCKTTNKQKNETESMCYNQRSPVHSWVSIFLSLYTCKQTNKKTFLKESQQVFQISIDNQATKTSSSVMQIATDQWCSFSGARTLIYSSSQDKSLHRITLTERRENGHHTTTTTNSK